MEKIKRKFFIIFILQTIVIFLLLFTSFFCEAKKENIKVYNNIAEMTSHFSNHENLCYVINDDSLYASGYKGNFYRYSQSEKFGEIPLDHGGVAVLVIPEFAPLKSNFESIDVIHDIAKSYADAGVQAKPNNGPFFGTPGHNKGIQCSQFVNAVLQGLYYENSKLANPSFVNIFIDGGCKWLDVEPWRSSGSGCMSANQLAHFAAAHGWFYRTRQFKFTEPGDIVFFQKTKGKSVSGNWNGITHCAIVVAREGHQTICLNAGSIAQANNLLLPNKYYPGGKVCAVNYQTIIDDEKEFFSDDYGLFGFARFPLTYLSDTIKRSR